MFDESKMGYGIKETDPTVYTPGNKDSQVEVELEKSDPSKEQEESIGQSSSQNSRVVNDQQTGNTNGYNLVRDKEKREIRPPQRYGQADLKWYALNIAELVEQKEPFSYKEAVTSKQSHRWGLKQWMKK